FECRSMQSTPGLARRNHILQQVPQQAASSCHTVQDWGKKCQWVNRLEGERFHTVHFMVFCGFTLARKNGEPIKRVCRDKGCHRIGGMNMDFFPDDYMVITLRLLMAALLSGLIGLEREMKKQPAGLRTHLLVG